MAGEYTQRIMQKIKEVEYYISELESILPPNLDEYKEGIQTKAACERLFEIIIEALTSISFLIIKNEKFVPPEHDKAIFEALSSNGIISDKLSERLNDAKGMRNIIVHNYGSVDDSVVFSAITTEIIADAKQLIGNVKVYLESGLITSPGEP